MKKSGGNGNPAAHYLRQQASDIRDEKEIFTIRTPEHISLHREAKNTAFGLSDELRLKQLSAENQRLKTLVEELMVDKFSQAHRIMELNDEKARLKKALADQILNDHN